MTDSLASSVVISASDLQRIRVTATSQGTAKDQLAKVKNVEAQEQQRKKATQRKERIIAAEKVAKCRKRETESDKLNMEKDNATLAAAAGKLDEELDDVKKMNQMMAYAKCVTIRDAQIGEKMELQNERLAEERRLDAIMEIERVKAIQRAGEVEAAKAKARRDGALVVVDQIKEREARRILELEQRELEQQMMLKQIKKMEEEDKQALEHKIQNGKALLAQVLDANKSQIEKKQEYKLLESAEEERRLQYLMEKDAKEAALGQEAARVKAEREAETLRLRAMQEKMADTKAEEDALRAKRAQEASEREWREKELAAAQLAVAKQQTMKIARNVQMREKERKLAEQAQLEKLEFERILNVQAEADARDRKEVELQMRRNKEHKKQLHGAIQRNEAQREIQRSNLLSEGGHLEKRMAAEVAKVERIKAQKLKELELIGVPVKYRSELQRFKPTSM